MADYLKILDGETLANISVQFDYTAATEKFVGLKLMPMVKTNNLKVAMYNLLKGHEIPVIALVHALDAEARISDRPNYEEIKEELLLFRDKINQGEELRKKLKDMGMDSNERAILNAIYDDISNEIMKVLTAFERRACELLSTGKCIVDENGAKQTVDYKLSNDNKIDFNGWNDPKHDIFADLSKLVEASGDTPIVRQIMSTKIFNYILTNEKMQAAADKQAIPLTPAWAKSYILSYYDIEIKVDDRKYQTAYNGGKKYRFFDEDTIISLTTRGEVGKTFMAPTPAEDANAVTNSYGFVTVSQYRTVGEPWTTYTEAEGLGLPVIADINNTLYLSKITTSAVSTQSLNAQVGK